MPEITTEDKYKTNPLDMPEAEQDKKIEAVIMQQPEAIRDELRMAWAEYKEQKKIPVLERTYRGDIASNLMYEKFFLEVLAGHEPNYSEMRAAYIQDTQNGQYRPESAADARVTQPIIGVDLTRESANAMVIEPVEDGKDS